MTFRPANSKNTFVDASIFLPDDASQLRLKLTDSLRDYATGINTREIGQYFLNEIVTGSSLYDPGNPQRSRPVYRKVINFGTLPNAGTKSVAHNISITPTFQIFKMYLIGNNPAATGATAYAITIPDTNSTLTLTKTDVVVTTGVDYSMYTNCSVVVEYAKT